MILLLNILIFSIFQECEDMLGYTGMVGYVKICFNKMGQSKATLRLDLG